MNYKLIFSTVLKVIKIEAFLMLVPLLTSLIYKENCFYSFLITIVVSFTVAHVIQKFIKDDNKHFYAKDGLITVALTWIAVSLIGAIPFVISGEIPSFIDAFFETVSGFTTTGASILSDVESLSKGLLMWRSFTHWVGGMGVLVFVMAIIPSLSDRSIHILRAEVPGPVVGKLVPKIRQTTRILYVIYIVLTLAETVFLLFGGMNLFEALVHAFGTAGTGGFSSRALSIGAYNPYIQWVVGIFMLAFGVNFNLYYLILLKKIKSVLKSSELWVYVSIVAVSVILRGINIAPFYDSLSETLRQAFFQVSSIITTTGYATADFNLWPNFSKLILLLLMFIGGCAGSTAGGIKVARVVMLYKIIKTELQRLLHPRSVKVSRFEGKSLDSSTLTSVNSYLAVYTMLFCAFVFIIGFNGFDIETTVSAVSACFNNIGPAFGIAGPAGSYADFSAFSKIVLSMSMLFGRLEIYPIILTLSASTWAKK